MAIDKFILVLALSVGVGVMVAGRTGTGGPEKAMDDKARTPPAVQVDSPTSSSDAGAPGRGPKVTSSSGRPSCAPPGGPSLESWVSAVSGCISSEAPLPIAPGLELTGSSSAGRSLTLELAVPESVYGREFPGEPSSVACEMDILSELVDAGAEVRLIASGPDGSRSPPIVISGCA